MYLKEVITLQGIVSSSKTWPGCVLFIVSKKLSLTFYFYFDLIYTSLTTSIF